MFLNTPATNPSNPEARLADPPLKVVNGSTARAPLGRAPANRTPMRVLVLSQDAHGATRTAEAVARNHPADTVRRGQAEVTTLRSTVEANECDVLVLEGFDRRPGVLAAVEQIAARLPKVSIVLLATEPGTEFVLEAVRAGVREIVPVTGNTGPLTDAIERIRRRAFASASPRANGTVIAFISAKGGSGATFIATNMAWALATEENKRVLLADLNLPFGEAEICVADRKASHSIADLAGEIHRLDPAMLDAALVRVNPNYGILATPEEPERAMDVKPEHVEQLLRIASAGNDYVVLDLGNSLDPVTVKALDRADHVFVVLQDPLPYVRCARRMHGVLRNLGYPPGKVHFVINRHDPRAEISLATIEKTIGAKVAFTVPNSYRTVATAINQGSAVIALNRKDAVSRALLDATKKLVALHARTQAAVG